MTSIRSFISWVACATVGVAASSICGCHEQPSDAAPEPGQVGQDTLALACEADRTCPGGGECDPVSLRCVTCSSDADCGGGGVCDPSARVCVQCVDDGDCDKGVCHPTRNLCVGCWQDDHCGDAATGGTGLCHPELLSCIECLADSDCAAQGGQCNAATFGCTGGCLHDRQCDDNDPCTTEACQDGACAYTKLEDCGCDDAALVCPQGSQPTDTNADQCLDACLCADGEVIRPGGICPCPETPVCPTGTKLVDTDRDGCADACECTNGAIIGPDGGCPCPSSIACQGGLVPSDLDGDGCPETCTRPCATDCDCGAQGLVADVPCPLACATCGPYLVCEDGVCQGRCGPNINEPCECPPAPECGPLQTAIDKDLDGCNDTCECLVASSPADPARCGCPFAMTCDEGSKPIDTNEDGCDDACACIEPNRVPRPDGTCCDPILCPAGASPFDDDGDLCPDACVCADGSRADDAMRCPCLEPIDCFDGALPVDTNEDGCADTCSCEDGQPPGPVGCGGCLADCSGQELPPATVFVDVDGDGCFDLVDACPIGTSAASKPGSKCPDHCVACDASPLCPARATAVDSDGDNCPDTCLCAGEPAPDGGCGCPAIEIVCAAPASGVDRDQDGCVDDCAIACTNPCECAGAADAAGFPAPECARDCVDCHVTSVCLEGFCAFGCGQATQTACLVAVDEPVCGCDDKTYTSVCEAEEAGAVVKREGACETSGCGSDADCADGELCELPEGACLVTTPEGTLAARGECQPVPVACVTSDAPTCGCDGVTYVNDCERRKAGTARASLGACPSR